MKRKDVLSLTLMFAIGALGAYFAFWFHFPAPFLIGPTITVSLLSLAGYAVPLPNLLRHAVFVLIGINLGASVDEESLQMAAQWPLSLFLLFLSLCVTVCLSAFLLKKWFGFSRTDAILASTPGHMSYVLALGAEQGSTLQNIVLIQVTRIMVLTLIVPFFVQATADNPAMVPSVVAMPMFQFLVLTFLAGLIGIVLQKWKVTAAFLIAGLLLSTASHLAGITPGSLPAPLLNFAYIALGVLIGSRFHNVKIANLFKVAPQSFLIVAVGFIVALIFSEISALLLDISPTQSFVAFAPGGLEAMIAIAMTLHIDVNFVALHHICRLFMLVGILAFLFRKSAISSK